MSGAEPISFRKAVPADAEAISALVTGLASYFLADPSHPEDAAFFFTTITPEAIRGYLEGDIAYHLAEADGALAGLIGIRGGSHVYHLFVGERFHRRGVAARLWERARNAAGAPSRFTVNASRYALPVYRRFGFVAEGPEVMQDGIAFQPMVWAEVPSGPIRKVSAERGA